MFLIILGIILTILVIYFVILLIIPKDQNPNAFVPEIEKDGVILITDKTEYEKGESVKITIQNNLDSQIEFWVIGIGSEDIKKDANIWNNVRFDIDCPCMADCDKTPVVLNSKEEVDFIWDQIGDDCQQVETGKYRVRADWGVPIIEYFEMPASISNEFIIK